MVNVESRVPMQVVAWQEQVQQEFDISSWTYALARSHVSILTAPGCSNLHTSKVSHLLQRYDNVVGRWANKSDGSKSLKSERRRKDQVN